MKKRSIGNSKPTELVAGDIEYEMGIPIPGIILPKEQWVQTAIKRLPDEGVLDMQRVFGRNKPLCVDLGCGNGRFALSSALRRPEWDHLAVDILPAVIRYGTRRGNQRGLSNLRFAVCDAWRFLETYLPEHSVSEFHIYHPQPYADESQSSKRMMTPDFAVLLHRCLTSSGRVFLQTDRRAYWVYIQQLMQQLFHWTEHEEPWPDDPNGRSRREVLSMDQQLTIFRGSGEKRNDLPDDELILRASKIPPPNFKLPSQRPTGFRRGRRN